MSPQAKPEIMVQYRRETIEAAWDDVTSLSQRHYEEIASYPDIPLKPDYNGYIQLEEKGRALCYTARVGHELIGYAVYIVCTHLHYSTSLQAYGDLVYVAPEWRRGRVANNMLDVAEDELKQVGVDVLTYHVKLDHPVLGVLLKRRGHRAIETIFSKRL